MVRSLAGSEIEHADEYLVVRTPANPTFWWGNFIVLDGGCDLQDHQRWIDLFRTKFPDSRHVSIGLDTADDRRDALRAFAAAGLTLEADAVMTATALAPPERPLQEGECRPLLEAADWEQAVALRQAIAVDGGDDASPGEREFLKRYVAEANALSNRGHGVYYGAFVAGRLVSYLGVVSDRGGTVRFQTVETHPDYRRRGLAGWLVYTAGTQGLEHFGAERLVIVADPEGPAIHLYRSLGFVATERQIKMEQPPAG
jgi:GNAT superfamily N-acetyltransferase